MNVFNTDSRFYRVLDKITDFLLLNLYWFICCLPIITIFPSTAAMFGVVREWLKKEEPGITKLFFTRFKENFKQSLLIEIIWSIFSAIIAFNLLVSFQMNDSWKYIMIPAFLFIGILFVCTSIFLFPIMVHYNATCFGVLKNSFLFSISQPHISLLGLLILGVSSIIIFFIPISFFALASLIAYILYHFCSKSFKKVEMMKNSSDSKQIASQNANI